MVVGPLGNSFPEYHREEHFTGWRRKRDSASLFCSGEISSSNNVSLIYGARSRRDLLFTEELGAFPLKEMALYTDDGSAYKRGSVVTDIKKIVEETI